MRRLKKKRPIKADPKGIILAFSLLVLFGAVRMFAPALETRLETGIEEAVQRFSAREIFLKFEMPFLQALSPEREDAAELSADGGLPAPTEAPESAQEVPLHRPGEAMLSAPPGHQFGTVTETTADPADMLRLLEARPIAAITIAPAGTQGYTAAHGVYIKNETDYEIDIDASLSKAVQLGGNTGGVSVLILHTHGSEAYSDGDRNYYLPGEENRSTSAGDSVVAVGAELAKILRNKGINVVHLTEMFDIPEFNSAYSQALEAIGAELKKDPSIRMVIDLHRDAMVTEEGVKYKTVTEISGEDTAQLMFVCGTDAGGLPHSSWQQNLRMAIRLQQKINTKYANLMRPINLRKERFNQHATTGSMLLEVGTSGNTMEEAVRAVRLFGEELGEFLKQY